MMTKTHTIPNFADVPLHDEQTCADGNATRNAWVDAIGGDPTRLNWKTNEQIPIQGLYTASDLEGVDHLETMPGFAPFLRGPYSTAFRWTR